MNNYESTKQTNTWLRQNGIDPEILNKLDLEILQAQMIASNLLKYHGNLLDKNQAASLNNFLQATRNAKKRRKLTLKSCYTVMNIGTAVNRKLFKKYRQQNKAG